MEAEPVPRHHLAPGLPLHQLHLPRQHQAHQEDPGGQQGRDRDTRVPRVHGDGGAQRGHLQRAGQEAHTQVRERGLLMLTRSEDYFQNEQCLK